MGNTYTVLDIAWFISANRLSLVDYPIACLHPGLGAWYYRLAARPEFAGEVTLAPELKHHLMPREPGT